MDTCSKQLYYFSPEFFSLVSFLLFKVGKALKSVADETEKSGVTLELKEISSKPETSKKELKGICGDLLEKVELFKINIYIVFSESTII